jgi:1,4-dihydroxy-6-naphthoate synthase
MMQISLAYSVDTDDAFMFYALKQGRVDQHGFQFTHQRGDTAFLNSLAVSEGADVIAISAGAYPSVASQYLILPHGASIGRGFGPVVVSRRPLNLAELGDKRVAIPGFSTTAYLVLRMMQPKVQPVVVPIVPFTAMFDALNRGDVDAALLIHEGRLLYEEHGFKKVCEVGEWWQAETGLPLPLGVNVIRRSLGLDTISQVSKILRSAIEWALGHRQEVLQAMVDPMRGEVALTKQDLLDRYLGMYANEDTRMIPEDAKAGLQMLYARATKAGLLPPSMAIDWAP